MPKINFYVRSEVEDQPVSIYLRMSDIWVRTEDTVFIRYWDKDKRWLKTGKNIAYTLKFTEKDRHNLETRLVNLKQHIASCMLGKSQPIDKDWLQEQVDKFYNVTVSKTNLHDYFEKYVSDMITGRRLNRAKRYSPKTTSAFKTVLHTFGEYQGIYSDKRKKYHLKNNLPLRPYKPLRFEDVNGSFIEDFKTFCLERGYHPNNTSILIERLKTILRAAKEDGLHKSDEYKRKAFKTSMVESMDIYLTEEEIQKLFKLNLDHNEYLKPLRDVFLCGCYTAQRYSDFSSYRKEMVKEITVKDMSGVEKTVRVLDFHQAKTGHRCTIPLRPELETILKRYDYSLPSVHYAALNESIKEICRIAGIDTPVYHEDYEGGLKVKRCLPKYKMVCTHTARRSGATNMKKAGMDLHEIAKIGGWRNMKTLQRYLKITEEEVAVKISDNAFFRGNMLNVV